MPRWISGAPSLRESASRQSEPLARRLFVQALDLWIIGRMAARRYPSAPTAIRLDACGPVNTTLSGLAEKSSLPLHIMRPTAMAEWDDAEPTRAERNRIRQLPAGPK